MRQLLVITFEERETAELMVVTFDDDLVMRVPPTAVDTPAAAEGLIRDIERIRGGHGTALWDALFRIAPYLEGREGRAAVILRCFESIPAVHGATRRPD